MISSSFSPQLGPSLQILSVKVKNPDPLKLLPKSQIKSQQFGFITKPKLVTSITTVRNLFEKMSEPVLFHKSVVPFVASLAIFLWSSPAEAGFLSGFPGIESVPGPQLPEIEFLNRFNEENQKKYAEADARFKESPLLKKLLEQSRVNKEKNKQEILDKYCIRGAEWGVGDCSAEGMSPDDRDKFIAMLKEKAGVK